MSKVFVDLHCHSTFSDGDNNIEQLIKLFRSTGTGYVSITDHDDIRSIKKLQMIHADDIVFIPGVELSTVYYDDNGNDYYIHILGYGIDPNSPQLRKEMLRYRNNRLNNNTQLLENIKNEGIPIPPCIYDEVKLENYNSIVSELKRCLIRNEFDNDFIESFTKTAKTFLPEYDGYEMDVFKAIELIKDAGGVPVLAHQQKINFYTENELLKFIKKAKKHGLMGIEVYYAEFNEEEINYNKNLATHFDLLESVGSDFHIIDDENKLPGLGINNNLCKTDCSLLDYLLEKKLVVSK